MSRLTWIVCGFVLLIGPHTLQAQHRGGRGTGAGRAPAGGSNSDDLKDFNRAVALQASPDQMTQFRQLTKSTQAARRVAQDLVQLAANTNRPDLSQNADALSNAVEEAQTENERFLRTFSDVQKSGLKDVTKKLGKANSEVTKQSKDLGRGLRRTGVDGKQIAAFAEKLDKALGDWQALQSEVGVKMGIQSEESSQSSSQ